MKRAVGTVVDTTRTNRQFNFVSFKMKFPLNYTHALVPTPQLLYRCHLSERKTVTYCPKEAFTTVTLENKTPAETFPKVPSVLRVIDRSVRNNPPIAATSVTFQPSLRHVVGL